MYPMLRMERMGAHPGAPRLPDAPQVVGEPIADTWYGVLQRVPTGAEVLATEPIAVRYVSEYWVPGWVTPTTTVST